MSLVRTKPLADCASAQEALSELCAGFARWGSFPLDFSEVEPASVPDPHQSLLVHESHMTRVLMDHYRVDHLDLYVMERHLDSDLYSRKIFLTRPNSPVDVEFGLVRLNLSYCPQPVRDEILGGKKPLGAILIEHNVLRRIEPKWFLKFPPNSTMLRWFGNRDGTPTFGRLGTIYCNGEPAVEVLEIVTNLPCKGD